MLFLISTAIIVLVVIVYGIKNGKAKYQPLQFIRNSLLIGGVISVIVGMSQGTFYSHGIDIYWYMFSLTTFCLIVVTVIIFVGLLKLIEFALKSK